MINKLLKISTLLVITISITGCLSDPILNNDTCKKECLDNWYYDGRCYRTDSVSEENVDIGDCLDDSIKFCNKLGGCKCYCQFDK